MLMRVFLADLATGFGGWADPAAEAVESGNQPIFPGAILANLTCDLAR